MLTRKIIEREFALSGSEQNPDVTGKSIPGLLRERLGSGIPAPIEAFMRQGADFAVDTDLRGLVAKMNAITGGRPALEFEQVEREVVARDREMDNPYSKDAQVTAIHGARRYLADRLTRVAAPHRLLDPDAGPLIAVRLRILTRKTLGGLETDLSGQALAAGGTLIPGLYAAGEVAGFGGGGDARLPIAGGHVPRRLPVLGAGRRTRPGRPRLNHRPGTCRCTIACISRPIRGCSATLRPSCCSIGSRVRRALPERNGGPRSLGRVRWWSAGSAQSASPSAHPVGTCTAAPDSRST